ncbi:unnamed protein product [Microthlaspi erraticum]|uniref:Uncharacterized protein n=1 Tax=Microthlaspi erraticum TaxID=1685480 RepID=A0A6D2IUP3_9BRAS|nr:unnamed protein product [Microthlaspi erraticum]
MGLVELPPIAWDQSSCLLSHGIDRGRSSLLCRDESIDLGRSRSSSLGLRFACFLPMLVHVTKALPVLPIPIPDSASAQVRCSNGLSNTRSR